MTRLVREFHEAFDQPHPDRPSLEDRDTRSLRVRLLCEELAEVICAMYGQHDGEGPQWLADEFLDLAHDIALGEDEGQARAPDAAEITKELADLRYVTDGAAVALGLPLDAAYGLVHDSNMSKLGADGKPIRREDGKALKGPNYQPAEPAIRRLLDA